MSFPKYPAYKPSGVEWLGEVPAHWEVCPLKSVIDRIESGVSVNAVDTPAESDRFGVLKTSCVYSGEFDPSENKAVIEAEYQRVACPVVGGTLIVSRMNTPDLVGAAGLTRQDFTNLFLPDRLWQVFPRSAKASFLHRWTQTLGYRAQVEMACAGTSSSMQNLGQDEFRAFVFACPPLDEQAVISAFLDQETTKIDALIAEQEQLITLLKEKRQAVISHAVTKGLDASTPMKDSGVAWLGEVPAHWEITPFKRLVIESVAGPYGASLTKEMYSSNGYRVYGQQQVIADDFTVGDYYIPDEKFSEMQRYSVFPGDLLVSVMGTIGKVAVVPDGVEPGIINPRLVRYRCFDLLDPHFAQKVLLSQKYQEHLLFEAKGTTMDGLNMVTLGRVPFVVPPVHEQKAIIQFITTRSNEITPLIQEAETAVALLQERRSALISAAVTGQIDVREAA